MLKLLIVGLGSFIGGAARYMLSTWVHRTMNNPWFPYGTLTVNVLGCLVIGFLAGLAESRSFFKPEVRLLLFIGILGGFTTYSSFALETVALAKDSQTVAAAVNLLLQIVLGLGAVWMGSVAAKVLGA